MCARSGKNCNWHSWKNSWQYNRTYSRKKIINILVLAHNYKSFIKGLIEATSKYVDKITVLINHNYLAEISKYLYPTPQIRHIRKYTKDNLMALNEKPENVDVHLVSLLYFITDGKNKSLGDKIANKAEKIINNKNIEFDIIQAHFSWPHGYVAVKLGQKYNVPVVITIHEGTERLIHEYNSQDEKIYWTWKNANALIRVNKKHVPLLKQFNKNVFYVPNGFSSSLFYPMERNEVKIKLNLPLDKKIILNVASLYHVKGQRYLIEAMKEIVKHRKDILCIIVGDGTLMKELKNQIKKLDLENYVKLVGSKPHDEISLWMNAANLFVLSSLSESFGVVQIEAMACGKPVVATKNDGSEEIIISDEYGLLCESENAKDLTEKILIGLDKNWDRENILEYAKHFTWDNAANEIMGIYKLID